MKQKPLSILFLISAVTILTFLSCKKDDSFMSNAVITGFDFRLCACCGGTIIKIDNVPNPNGGDSFLVGQFPAGFDLGINPQFPIAVKIDWQLDTLHCYGRYISITRIKKAGSPW